MKSELETRYEVALSFAGEQREYVEEAARALHSRGIAVFYDEFEKVVLWGKHLHEELQSVYECRSAMAVIFVSKEWVEKAWPRHERRAILTELFKNGMSMSFQSVLMTLRFLACQRVSAISEPMIIHLPS